MVLHELSELEGVVLGIIQLREPCTAYEVRLALKESPSSFWSASAGAIYPLIRRLEKAALVKADVDADDRRGRRLCRLTAVGRRAHTEWMLLASSMETAAAVSDTVRSRSFFLDTLAPEDRRRFVDGSLRSLEAFLEAARADLKDRAEADDACSYWAALGGVYQAEARVKWMRELRAHLLKSGS